jgi:hypothetical protein
MPTPPTLVERALRRPQSSLVVVLVAVPLACWAWVAALARHLYDPMIGASAWMMTLAWDMPRVVPLWAMTTSRPSRVSRAR